jgi:uncharacterized RDD family membrane protein YckC
MGGSAPPPAGESQWTAPPPPAGTPVPGAGGFVYADVPNRAIAYIIDVIIFVVIALIVGIVLAIFLPQPTIDPDNPFVPQVNPLTGLVTTIVYAVIGAAYFIYQWTSMRATIGMRVLGMQIGNAADGATITTNQAVTRYLVMFGPGLLAQLLGAFVGALGLLLSLAGLVWLIVLLVTTAQSPTKQGLHDRYANTVVVKSARSVG